MKKIAPAARMKKMKQLYFMDSSLRYLMNSACISLLLILSVRYETELAQVSFYEALFDLGLECSESCRGKLGNDTLLLMDLYLPVFSLKFDGAFKIPLTGYFSSSTNFL